MKTLTFATIALLISGSALAQTTSTPAPSAQTTATDEVRSTSAQLKEAYGMLSQELAHLGREMGPDATQATAAQLASRDQMKATLARLEGVLTTVNTVSADQWIAAKEKALMVRKEAMDLVAARQKTKR